MSQLITNLVVGDKIKYGSYQVEASTTLPIIWKVIDQNHTGYPANSVTLLTDKIIDLRGFDAKEPANADDRASYGNNRYRTSNLRQWLNSNGAANAWWVAQNLSDGTLNTNNHDATPDDAGMTHPTGYDDIQGFMNNFTALELTNILDTTLIVAKNTVTDGGGSEVVTDKVFLLSRIEVGLGNENYIAEGSLFSIFAADADRISYMTDQNFNNNLITFNPDTVDTAWDWWLRTPYAGKSYESRFVDANGTRDDRYAYGGFYGVRPALNLASDTLVSDVVDVDGCYTVGSNSANTPAKSTVSVSNSANVSLNSAVNLTNLANTSMKSTVSVTTSIDRSISLSSKVAITSVANVLVKSAVDIGLTASVSAKSTLNIVSSAKTNLSSTVNLTKLANTFVKSTLNVELTVNISANMLALHFYPVGSRKNPIVIKENMYHRGSAKLVSNSQNIVNKLWVKGGKAQSELYTQDITVGTIPIPLFYPPRSPVTVIIGGVVKTLGIQNIDATGTKDFLLNVNEKLLIPDLVTTGTGTISYLYEYPIKILLEEPLSQVQYGIFEDVLTVSTDDKELAIELGLKHLFKYSQPVISGSLSPFTGTFKAGETIKVEIPRLKIDSELLIKSVTLDSTPMEPIVITLNLETPERDLSNILKDLKQRLDKLEKDSYKDDEGPILKYIAKEELYSWIEDAGNLAYACPFPSETLYPAEGLYPC